MINIHNEIRKMKKKELSIGKEYADRGHYDLLKNGEVIGMITFTDYSPFITIKAIPGKYYISYRNASKW